jgi:hypothetical protein
MERRDKMKEYKNKEKIQNIRVWGIKYVKVLHMYTRINTDN